MAARSGMLVAVTGTRRCGRWRGLEQREMTALQRKQACARDEMSYRTGDACERLVRAAALR